MIQLLSCLALGATLRVGVDGDTVQATIDAAQPGDVIEIPAGEWAGDVRVDKTVTLKGRGGVITSFTGKTVVVAAPNVVLDNLKIVGSGRDLTTTDSCVYFEPQATDAIIRDSSVSDCLFGIWIHTTHGVQVLDNHVVGRAGLRDSDRGNGIHLFDADGLVVSGNLVEHSRDGVYVSATENSLIAGNHVSHMRYGIHYMFSYDNEIRDNVATHNIGGVALMSSFRLKVHGNVATDNKKHGLFFRDIQYCDIHHNTVQRNGEGLFFYSSLDNKIHHNLVQANDRGARIWAGTERNEVWANSFVGNRQQVYYVARDDQTWGTKEGGNHWSDYIGWDHDGDGLGDRPYRVDSMTSGLLHAHPEAVLLLGSPSLELLRQVQTKIPALRVPTIIDTQPVIKSTLETL
ncbi:MAG: nitrous oxidase accessory protein [Kiritimatiellia bacterium]|jgi:nitrous oxidase accessory protein